MSQSGVGTFNQTVTAVTSVVKEIITRNSTRSYLCIQNVGVNMQRTLNASNSGMVLV